MLKTLLLLIVGCSVLVVSCGKKAGTKDNSDPEITRPESNPDEEYLKKQNVSCEANQNCPNYIAKIVVKDNNSYRFCTGFLVDKNIMGTSTSCLPSYIRLANSDCTRDVFVYFPKTSRPAERVGCVRITQVSDLEGVDPILWRDDVSFFEITETSAVRRRALISTTGIPDYKQFNSWMVDQMDDYSAIIRQTTCEATHKSYVNPLSMNEHSPNVLFADCSFKNGATGAPIVDSRGDVRAIISSPMDPKIRKTLEETKLLENGLKDMIHASNFACAPNPQTDEVRDRECYKPLSYSDVDRIRTEMLSTNIVIGTLRRKYEDLINAGSKYVRYGVKLITKDSNTNRFDTEIYPKCFRPYAEWLSSLSKERNMYTERVKVTLKSFKKTMDPNARVFGQGLDGADKIMEARFSLKDIREDKSSAVSLTLSGTERKFPRMSDQCQPSLF